MCHSMIFLSFGLLFSFSVPFWPSIQLTAALPLREIWIPRFRMKSLPFSLQRKFILNFMMNGQTSLQKIRYIKQQTLKLSALLINLLQEDIGYQPLSGASVPLVESVRHHQAKRSQWKPTKTRAVIPYPRIGKRGMEYIERFAFQLYWILSDYSLAKPWIIY